MLKKKKNAMHNVGILNTRGSSFQREIDKFTPSEFASFSVGTTGLYLDTSEQGLT